jgi:hypothetical protein
MSRTQQNPPEGLYTQICNILNAAQASVARSVNTAQVLSNWLIGRAIVEEEQQGSIALIMVIWSLAKQLKQDFGAGYSYSNLKDIPQFYIVFPQILTEPGIGHALRDQSLPSPEIVRLECRHV